MAKINDIKSDLTCYNANINSFRRTIDDFNKNDKSIKDIVDYWKVYSGVHNRVYTLVIDIDKTLGSIFKKLANNSFKTKEIQYPIKRKYGKKF